MINDELFPASSAQNETKDLKRVFFQYARYWYIFLISAVISLVVAFCYLRYYAVPQYSVYSTLLIKDDKNGKGLSNADAFGDLEAFKSTKNIDNEIEVIKSKSLMTRVITELGLFTSYYVKGRVRDIELYGNSVPIKVFISKLDSAAPGKTLEILVKTKDTFEFYDYTGRIATYRFGQQIRRPYGTFSILLSKENPIIGTKIIVRFQDIQQVAAYYSSAISINSVNKNTSLVQIKLVDPIPNRAKDVINKLMDVYNKEAIEDKNLMASNTLRFLDDRLQYLTTDLSGVEKAVEKYKIANGLTDINTQAATYTEQASSYNTRLFDWDTQITILESLETYLSKDDNRYAIVPSTLGIKDETLLGLIAQFNSLQLTREQLLRTNQSGNPLVQATTEQLAILRTKVLENLRNIKKGLQITRSSLEINSGKFQAKIKRVPAMEREMLEINRQKLIKQNIYSYLLQKREETALSLASTVSAARVIDLAISSDYPISPNKQVIYLIALMLGLGIPFAGVYMRNLLDNKVQHQDDITAMTTVPILGEIAHNDTPTVVVAKDNRSAISEMFRLVRANLSIVIAGKESPVLLVTSSRSGEGKTFFSINLSASLALTGKRVVLLDLDLRNPKVAKELDMPEKPGVANYLMTNDTSLDAIIRISDEAPNLFIISAGALPPNPSELIMSSKFTHLMHELKNSFDYIIIDTPPVGQFADAFALSSFVDFTIYIVRYNYTYKIWLNIIKNIYKSKMLNHPLIILNDAKEMNNTGYGYGYGYGYEYDKEKFKKSRTTH
jgi:tyrosine-protein kinase Etk/Wzc